MKHFEEAFYSDIITGLQQLKSVQVSPSFKKRVHRLLVPMLRPANKKTIPPFISQAVPGIMLLLFLIAGTGTVMAIDTSLPDNILYPIKKIMERARLVFSTHPAIEADTHLKFGDKRIEEMKKSIQQGNQRVVPTLANEYANEVHRAVSAVPTIRARVQTTVAQQQKQLEEIQKQLPSPAQHSVQPAIQAAETTKTSPERESTLTPTPQPTPEPVEKEHTTVELPEPAKSVVESVLGILPVTHEHRLK